MNSLQIRIQNALSLGDLNYALVLFQQSFRRGELAPEEVSEIVALGKAKRAELTSAAEGKKKFSAQEALSKAVYQGPGGVPRPNPRQMKDDEHQLYLALVDFDPAQPNAFTKLEEIELWYCERERSDYGKQWILVAMEKKMQEISDLWAESKGEAR